MADENRIFKNISFNKNDNFEMRLFAHANRQGMFAKYVKRLIQRDMEGTTQPVMVQSSYMPQQVIFTSDVEKIETPPVFQQEEQKEKPQSVSSFI